MIDAEWYTTAAGDGLEQGDLLTDCPVDLMAPIPVPAPVGFMPDVDVETHDLIVMTQSCDLVNEKVDQVLLAKVTAWAVTVAESAAANPFVKSKEYRKKLVDGIVPGYALLNRHAGPPSLPWSVVDFHRLFVLPKPYAQSLAATRSPLACDCDPRTSNTCPRRSPDTSCGSACRTRSASSSPTATWGRSLPR